METPFLLVVPLPCRHYAEPNVYEHGPHVDGYLDVNGADALE
jgi:hypothetical protein